MRNFFSRYFGSIFTGFTVLYVGERTIRSNEKIAKMQIISNERIAASKKIGESNNIKSSMITLYQANSKSNMIPLDQENIKSSIIPFDFSDISSLLLLFDNLALFQKVSIVLGSFALMALYSSIWILIYSDPFNLNMAEKIKKILPNILLPIYDLNLKMNKIFFKYNIIMVFICLILIIFYAYRFYNLSIL